MFRPPGGPGRFIGDSSDIAGAAVVWLIDAVLVAGSTNGQSLGKRLAGIRIVRDDGRRYRHGTALLRDALARLLFLIPLFFLADSLAALGSEHQTLRDRMAGTRVMREPVYRSRRWPLSVAAVLSGVVLVALLTLSERDRRDQARPGTYTTFERESFISGCSQDGDLSEHECGCAFDRIAARLPHSEFDRANRTDTRNWPRHTSRVFADAVNACAGPPPSNAPEPAGTPS